PTSRARRTRCRSRGWPPRRPSWRPPARARENGGLRGGLRGAEPPVQSSPEPPVQSGGRMRDLTGVSLPVPTPYRGEQIATDQLKANLARWARTDLVGYVLLGSTGEFPMLSEA